MDPAEAIFSGLVRLWKRVRPTPAGPPPGAALLEPHTERLERFAALLFGEPMTLTPADDAGGLRGPTLLLPRTVALFDEVEPNVEVYLYRIAWAATAREHTFDDAAAEGTVGALVSLLATRAVLAHMHRQLPQTQALTERLAARELEQRGTPAHETPKPGTEAALLDALAHALLLDAAAGETSEASASASASAPAADARRQSGHDAWLSAARSTPARSASEVAAAAEASLRALRSLGLPRGGAGPQVRMWGRLWASADAVVERADSLAERGAAAHGDREVVALERTIRLERVTLGPREDRPLFHVFEKLETAEDYAGQSATPDAGSAEAMDDALRDLTLGAAIRTTDQPQQLARADVVVDEGGVEVRGGAATVDPRVFRYPEWHHGRGEYRPQWVTLSERRWAPGADAAGNRAAARAVLRERRGQVEDIRGQLMRALRERRARARSTDGPEIDIGAMVERHADLAAGQTPSERLYVSARRSLREVAVLVLLDASFSTDAWLEGRRVIDIEIQSLLVLSAALEGVMDEEIAVASFSSHTRHDVRFDVLKGFEDSWEHLRTVAPSIAPDGYTRIGAAVRHGAAILEAAHAEKKLLLVLSDGKPIDFDRYEGRYGVEDVGRAVREAREARIHCFGLAIEKEAKLHLARMLGPGRYRVLPRTSRLPEVMADAFLDVLAG